MSERIVFSLPLKGRSHEERLERAAEDASRHHAYHAEWFEFIPASEIEKKWGR